MSTIAIVNTKGGVGKTTTAVMLAAAAVHDGGYNTTVVDTDPQGSASQWVHSVLEESPELPLELVVANMSTLSALDPDALNIIDTPPGNPAVIDRAMQVADFIVIPTTPSLGDIGRVWETIRTIPQGTPVAVLQTQVNSQAVLTENVRAILEDNDVVVLPTDIPRREYFRKIYGSWPTADARHMLGYDDVFSTLMEAMK